MYIYLDENQYVYGYGSEPEENSIQVNFIPEEVDKYLGAYKYIDGQYIENKSRVQYLIDSKNFEKEYFDIQAWLKDYENKKNQHKMNYLLGLQSDIDLDILENEATDKINRMKEIEKFLSIPFSDIKEEEI